MTFSREGKQMSVTHRITVIGGTGPQGKGLAYRFANAGHSVTLGSRSSERAEAAATEITARLDGGTVAGAANQDALLDADVVILAVPYQGHAALVDGIRTDLASKIVISCVNPLGFDKTGPFALDVEDRSAAEEAQRLAPAARLVGAFHHLSAANLWGDAELLSHEDVLVCGDDPDAKEVVADLARSITGRKGIDAGPLRMARQLEPLTGVLISINKRYKVRSGISVVGLSVE